MSWPTITVSEMTLSHPQTFRILDKYLLPNKNLSFVEKRTGKYYAFRSPENKYYLISEDTFSEKFVGHGISSTMDPDTFHENDTFRINNKEFSSVLQYKRMFVGDYYVMRTFGNNFIISGLDVDTLSPIEKKMFEPTTIY